MKDLDFDELDRAVSSVLGVKDTSAKEKAVEDAADLHEIDQPTDGQGVATSSDESVASGQMIEKKPLVERRPTGRFMDVMHSSSDMKSRPKPTTVSHTSTTITPIGGTSHEDKVSTDTAEGSAPIAPPKTEESIPRDTNDSADAGQHTFPDPLDFHNFSIEDTGEAALAQSSEQEADNSDNHDLALDTMASELNGIDGLVIKDNEPVSVDTPFLNGSTIEKRPLGAFSVNAEDVETSLLSVKEETLTDSDEKSSEVITNDEDDSEHNVISERKDDIDSDDTSAERDAQTLLDAEVIPEELKGEIVSIEASPVEAPASSPLAAGSIQPQYTEKVQVSDNEPTPVFDTTDYHQPLKHAPKQKSGWLGVMLIIVFIVAGIGAGAAVYFFDPFGLK